MLPYLITAAVIVVEILNFLDDFEMVQIPDFKWLHIVFKIACGRFLHMRFQFTTFLLTMYIW